MSEPQAVEVFFRAETRQEAIDLAKDWLATERHRVRRPYGLLWRQVTVASCRPGEHPGLWTVLLLADAVELPA